MGYINLFAKVLDAVKWVHKNPRPAFEIALVVALVFVGWRYNRKAIELDKVKTESGQLADGLKLQIKIANGQIEILRKKLDGSTSSEHVYVPPEGYVVVQQKELALMRAKLNWLMELLKKSATAEEKESLEEEIRKLREQLGSDVIITVKDKGFTVRPGFGIEWAGYGLSPRLDLKLAYYKRYSLLVGGGKDGVDVSASRHLDDIIFGRPQNLEIFAGWLFLPMRGNRMPVLGLRSNF